MKSIKQSVAYAAAAKLATTDDWRRHYLLMARAARLAEKTGFAA